MRYLNAYLVLLTALLCTCRTPDVQKEIDPRVVPLLWADLTLDITKHTPANTPTFASRALGYIGLTMFESVVNGSPRHRSLAGQLNGMPALPKPENKEYNWVLSMNAAQAEIIRSIYIQTSKENKRKIDSLEQAIFHAFSRDKEGKEVGERSAAYGKSIASAIFEWSKTDGGHRGYLTNFDPKYKVPTTTGTWQPPFYAQTISRLPLHPHWGNNRTFLVADSGWKMPAFLAYDTSRLSDCFKQFQEVYVANKNITQQQKEIALWWNDDPSDTYTPPGHSYNVAKIVVRSKKPDIFTAAETFARTGIAVADAFIVCWRMKYKYVSLRPSSYVSEHIDDQWDPFWPDPPFPAFPSGHATQASAVAVVLAGLYGDSVEFEDDTHVGRPKDLLKEVEYKARKFNSFWQAAEETAYSRFLGGIHTQQDNSVGLQEGTKVGQHINSLKWYN